MLMVMMMTMMSRIVLILGLLLVTLAATASAVSCYECDSYNDLNCGVDFQPDDIAQTQCETLEPPEEMRALYMQNPETACLTKYYKGDLDEALFVRRSCHFGADFDCDEEPDPVMPQLSFYGCIFCRKNLCNASTQVANSERLLWSILISLLTLINF